MKNSKKKAEERVLTLFLRPKKGALEWPGLPATAIVIVGGIEVRRTLGRHRVSVVVHPEEPVVDVVLELKDPRMKY